MSVAARRLFAFDNSYVRELEGLYVPWQAASAPAPAPRLLALSEELAAELGVDADGRALLSARCSTSTGAVVTCT
jgi:hypothetical protein